jgi:hypothetical protein
MTDCIVCLHPIEHGIPVPCKKCNIRVHAECFASLKTYGYTCPVHPRSARRMPVIPIFVHLNPYAIIATTLFIAGFLFYSIL